MNDLPPGGEFLFIGGSCDGQRKYISHPLPAVQIFTGWVPEIVFIMESAHPPKTPTTMDKETYILERVVSADGQSFCVYLEHSKDPRYLIKTLIEGYRFL